MTNATEFIDEPDTIRNEAVDNNLLVADNQTTELREKLTERGVDWLDESNGYADVTTFITNDVKWTVISKSYLNPEHDWMTLRAERITPEQAIAATLVGVSVGKFVGLKKGKIHENHIMSEYYCGGCGWPVTDHDSYCCECGGALHEGTTLVNGKLTAEQVRGVLLLNLPHREYYSIEQTDAWQTIADELNAVLGGTCENVSDSPEGFLCSVCGWGDFAEPSHLLTTAKYAGRIEGGPNFCPNCGLEVLKNRR